MAPGGNGGRQCLVNGERSWENRPNSNDLKRIVGTGWTLARAQWGIRARNESLNTTASGRINLDEGIVLCDGLHLPDKESAQPSRHAAMMQAGKVMVCRRINLVPINFSTAFCEHNRHCGISVARFSRRLVSCARQDFPTQ
jgi:hypothetical protein